jgi:hypothetical protein
MPPGVAPGTAVDARHPLNFVAGAANAFLSAALGGGGGEPAAPAGAPPGAEGAAVDRRTKTAAHVKVKGEAKQAENAVPTPLEFLFGCEGCAFAEVSPAGHQAGRGAHGNVRLGRKAVRARRRQGCGHAPRRRRIAVHPTGAPRPLGGAAGHPARSEQRATGCELLASTGACVPSWARVAAVGAGQSLRRSSMPPPPPLLLPPRRTPSLLPPLRTPSPPPLP